MNSYCEFEVKQKKIHERESLAPIGKTYSGSQQALTMKYTNYKNRMTK